MNDKKLTTGEKVCRRVFGSVAYVGLGALWVTASIGAAPFDRGTTMKALGKAISQGGKCVFPELWKWTIEK